MSKEEYYHKINNLDIALNEDEIKFREYLLILNSEFPTHRKTEAMEELLKIYNKEKEKNKELEEENEELHNEINQRVKLKLENERIVDEDYIPKSKVREKIEILEKHKQSIKPNTLDTAYKQAYCDGGIDSLNEIL